jgi:ribonuclease J
MSDFVEVIPLGGLGEFGMNCTMIRSDSDVFLVDAGMAFPQEERGNALGVRVIVPDTSYLGEIRDQIRGVVLTHGHEDHIGAVSFIAEELEAPIYGSRLTLGLVSERLKERGLTGKVDLRELEPRHPVKLGSFSVEPLYITHSYPESFCLAISTSLGRLIWTGDFKFDQTPIDGKASDLHRLAAYGEDGVLALFSDSTNSRVPGLAPSEWLVREPLGDLFQGATGKIIASTFSTSIHRIQILLDLAEEFDRVVLPVGRSIVKNIRIASELGYLRAPEHLLKGVGEAKELPARNLLVLAAGSQGEPMSALTRLAVGQFKNLEVQPDDSVILSTRIIPGNEKAISRMVNHFFRRGARVYDIKHSRVHVSGHGYQDDLKLMINLTKPEYFIPIHGEYSQLKGHTWIARDQGIPSENIRLIENGDVLRFEAGSVKVTDKISVARRYIDDGILEDVHELVLRERRFLSEDGFVVVILRLDRLSGKLIGEPELISRGFVMMEESEALVAAAQGRIIEIVDETSLEEKQDSELFDEIVRKGLRKLFRKLTAKRPIVLSLTIEI